MDKARPLSTLLVVAVLTPVLCAAALASAQDTTPQPQEQPQPEAPAQPQPPAPPVRRAADAARWLENIELVQNVVYATVKDAEGNERELQLDAAFPKQGGDAPLPAVIYIHGGGWVGGHRDAGLPFTVAFANGGYFACTISYRLSGEATYPAAVHDCKAAVRFLRANADDLGVDPQRIGVWGHSAGGHLSAMLGLTGDDAALEGEVGATGVSSDVACFVSVCGPTQLTGLAINGMVASFLGGASDEEREERAREASPVTHVERHDPPGLLVHGTNDDLVNIRQSQLLLTTMDGARAQCQLHTVEGAGHAIRDREAYVKIAAFFDEHLGGDAARVMSAVDWNRLTELRPVEEPKLPVADLTHIPEPLDEATINSMSLDDVRDAMANVAIALTRSDALEGETRQRLRNEFRMLRDRLRAIEDAD